MTNEEFLKHAEKYYDQKSFEHAKKLVQIYYFAKRIKIECHYFREHRRHEHHDYGHPCPIVTAFNNTIKDLERE